MPCVRLVSRPVENAQFTRATVLEDHIVQDMFPALDTNTLAALGEREVAATDVNDPGIGPLP